MGRMCSCVRSVFCFCYGLYVFCVVVVGCWCLCAVDKPIHALHFQHAQNTFGQIEWHTFVWLVRFAGHWLCHVPSVLWPCWHASCPTLWNALSPEDVLASKLLEKSLRSQDIYFVIFFHQLFGNRSTLTHRRRANTNRGTEPGSKIQMIRTITNIQYILRSHKVAGCLHLYWSNIERNYGPPIHARPSTDL